MGSRSRVVHGIAGSGGFCGGCNQCQADKRHGRAAYFSGCILTRSNPSTSAFRYLLDTSACLYITDCKQLTRPCQSPRCPSRSLHRGCGAARLAASARAPGAAGLSVLRRRIGGKCPCGPFQPRRTGTCRGLSDSHDTSGRFPYSCCSERARAIWRAWSVCLAGAELHVARSGGAAVHSALTHSTPS
jgi:hypothetical protein